MNFDNYKFHPSSLVNIMTDAKSDKDILGATCKKYLAQCYVGERYGRKKDITSKYMEKGIVQEEESITLYSLVTKTFHKKNTEEIQNDFFIGTPDLYDGANILKAKKIIDIKTSWDIFTFFNVLTEPINKTYVWQLQAYMDLTGAQTANLVYCLVDTPPNLIEDAKRKLQWAMNVVNPLTHGEFIKQCEQIEKNMTFGDIPKEERYIEFSFPRDQDMIDRAHQRVKECREYLNTFSFKDIKKAA